MKKTVTPLYMFFGVLFVTCLLLSNIAASKMIMIGPWAVTAGILIFPIAYIMSDVIAEVYGFKKARNIMWLGFAMNAFMVLYFMLAIAIHPPVWFEGQSAFATVLGSTPRLFVASLTAYVCGAFLNAAVISKMKVLTKGKGFSIRAVVSTIIGESVDSTLFITIAFIGILPKAALLPMIITQLIMKTVYEIVVLPFTSVLVRKVKKVEKLDTFDTGVKYGLFK